VTETERTLVINAETGGVKAELEQALFELKRVIVGQEEMLERVLVALLAGGHLLIEGVPGLAKTLTVKTLAEVFAGTFHRIQFTPDLVPADLVGTRIYRPTTGEFDTELGPVFCNVLLADEINRAPAKVQSALLEVMQEHQVTIGGRTFPVPEPFLVLATQNPIESEGTYPLPEAQVDRFLLKILVDYPDHGDELTVVQRSLVGHAEIEQVISLERLRELQGIAGTVYVDPQVADYAVRLVLATRRPSDNGLPRLSAHVAYGASPRGSIGLIHAARALALLRGRRYALPQDVHELAKDVLRHRLVLTYEALADEITPDTILDAVLGAVSMPRIDLAREAA
jgi:MoxR-like ATPase